MQSKALFWAHLENYRRALESKNSRAIIVTSLRIYSALGSVPKHYKRYVNQVFKKGGAR